MCVLWSALLAVLALRTGSVIVDGFQCAGALAGSPGPGSLRWPFVGGFMGYDQAWGFHWFGWQWLRSLALPVMPWSPEVDIALLAVLWGATAWWAARLVEQTSDRRLGLACGALTLAAPGLVVALQSYRPEIPAAAGLLLLAGSWEGPSRLHRVLRALLLVTLPSIHPLCVVVPAAWWAGGWYFEYRRSGVGNAVRRMLPQGLALAGGLLMFAAWYALQPHALEQFKSNIASQRLLVEGLGSGYLTFFRWGFGGLGAIPLIVLLVPAVLRGAWVLFKSVSGDRRPEWLAAVAVLVAILFNWAGRNPNPLHLVAIIPFAAWLLASLLAAVCRNRIPCLFPGLCVALACMFGAYPARQTFRLFGKDGHSYRSGLVQVLEELPPAHRVYIPVCLWEAAAKQGGNRWEKYRFSTFPNILTRGERVLYEQEILSGLEAGDLLVWDVLQDEGGIFNFVMQTALKHQLIRPPEQGDAWEPVGKVEVLAAYSSSQSREFLIYRKK